MRQTDATPALFLSVLVGHNNRTLFYESNDVYCLTTLRHEGFIICLSSLYSLGMFFYQCKSELSLSFKINPKPKYRMMESYGNIKTARRPLTNV